ncbi:D-2-hydroxyacid dehydrogenase [Leuconostoc pseudomesenteroides]|jgi:D-lactate dehydrogenase|uniref:D-2-hydroxyacid dehydrogenase n=2 Tax=Leuconostoc falkenbergense TaxID=2766470 RepID=A0A9X3E634_9LACO|nr:D-2-hydroxyacid dehydrogenase [Leuconostoc falkenbergense]RDG18805.1 D-2-hydroxyacid dehydrogenase [Leuconostoc pseudomesenteroides]MCT4377760.1 D-2-hydroxyacid dehydrogenase [Leuconostoc falkenbergense]MCT4389146.1 D-2-hydroxyacid dehydrogenase [Leuconostoc falkenbergense]MCX7577985.1 D-2-hydroxyacid dehydrogenase [Leuconostoc falkenbergense]MDI6667453.1 D-2-hydroxyacid dehydrogenase [Leuconostoc falkenbergense]
MKILMYNAVADELPYVKKWSEKTGHEVVTIDQPLNEETVDRASGFDAVSTQQTTSVNPPVYERLSQLNIKQIALRQVGYDVFDLPAAFANHVRLSNVAAYSPRAIAEYTLTQLFNLIRHNKKFDRAMAQGDYTWAAGGQAREIHDLTVAIIGVGRIGTALAEMLHALGAQVLGVDPVYRAQNEPFVTYTTLDEALRRADVISFHTPLNDETRGLADRAFFEKVQPGTIMLNFARGEIVDMTALESALASGQLAGAAFDVAPNENDFMDQKQTVDELPENIQRLVAYDNFLLSPHIAFYTNTAIKNMVEMALNDAVIMVNGGFTENEILR